MANKYTYLQGRLYVAQRSAAGAALGFYPLGNCPKLSITLGLTAAQYATAQQPTPGTPGYQAMDKSNQSQDPTVDMDLESVTKENLAMAMYGDAARIPSRAAASDTITCYVGRAMPLSNIAIQSFTSLTVAGTSTVARKGIDYDVNLTHGTITLLIGGAYPDGTVFTAVYDSAAYDKVNGFTTAPPILWVRFEGLNMVSNASPVVVDIFKVRMQPIDAISLIGDALTSISLKGRVMLDRDPNNPASKRFMQITQV